MSDSGFFARQAIAKPHATRFAQQIIELGYKQYPNGGREFVELISLISELTLQNIICSILIKGYEPGAAEGEEAIKEQYEIYKTMCLKRWNAQDLKDARAEGKI